MTASNNKKENSKTSQKSNDEKTDKEGTDKFYNGLKILAELIAKDIIEKRKNNLSDKQNM